MAKTSKAETTSKPEGENIKNEKAKGPEKVKTIEELGIDPRTPYPSKDDAAKPAEE